MDKAMAVAVSMTTTTTTHCDQTGTRLLARSQTQDNIHKETTTDKKTAATRYWSLMILIDRVFDIEVLVAALFLTCLRHSQVFQQCSLFGNKIKSDSPMAITRRHYRSDYLLRLCDAKNSCDLPSVVPLLLSNSLHYACG